MIISIILLFFISKELESTSKNKRQFVLFFFLAYAFFAILELIYLNYDYSRSIHFSDPTDYYDTSKNLKNFSQIFSLESTNVFYFIINYYYINIYDSEVVFSLLIRFNNIFLIIYIYLLLSQVTNRVRKIDYLFVFNPYLFLIAVRNVRDLYILLFVILFLLSIGALPKRDESYSRPTLIISVIMLILVRPICLVPLGFVYLLKYRKQNRFLGVVAVLLFFVALLAYREIIVAKVMNQFISAGDYVGEDVSIFAEMLDGGFSGAGVIAMTIRIIKAIVSLLCTPHPIKYFNTWITHSDSIGTYNIYTGLDNLLIVIGSCFIYLYILPLIMKLFLKMEMYKKVTFQYAILFALIYAISYLGITDIRNHFIVYIFLLLPVFATQYDMHPSKKSTYIVIAIFIFLLFL